MNIGSGKKTWKMLPEREIAHTEDPRYMAAGFRGFVYAFLSKKEDIIRSCWR